MSFFPRQTATLTPFLDGVTVDFSIYTIVVLMLAFCWSGFVRAGLGFGGAGLMYPIALLAVDSVLFLVPIICVQLLVFSSVTLVKDRHQINWKVVCGLLAAIMPTYLIGVFGLITLPEQTVLLVVYAVIIGYSLNYIFAAKLSTPRRWVEVPALLLGGYVSGLSLSGAPIIAAVGIKYLDKHQIRASFFVLWTVVCVIKLGTLHAYDVSLQLVHQLWLLPCAFLGHFLGLKVHGHLLRLQSPMFYRVLGYALLVLCLVSMGRQFFSH